MLNNVHIKFYVLTITVLLGFIFSAKSADDVKSADTAIAYIDSLDSKAYKLIRQDVSQAFSKLTEAEMLSEKLKYKKGLATTYLHQAGAYNQIGYIKRALELYYRCIRISRQNNDIYTIARAEQYISAIVRKSGAHSESERLLLHTLKTFKLLNKPLDIVNAQLYLGLLKVDTKDYTKAKAYYDSAYVISKKANYTYGEKKSYYDRAMLYEDTNQPDSAVLYLNKALKIDTIAKDVYGRTLSYIELCKVYLNSKKLNEAVFYGQQAYNSSIKANALLLQENSIELMVDACIALNDTKAVITWQDKLINLNDVIAEREKQETIRFIEVLKKQDAQRFKMQSKVAQMQETAHEQSLITGASIALLIVIVVAALNLHYSYRKAKAHSAVVDLKNRQIAEQLSLLDQLNREITKQNQKLESDNDLKNRLLSIISHDLRRPLSNTQSLIQLANMGYLSNEERADLFVQLDDQYAMALGLLDSMLFWIKGQVAGIPAEDTMVNMHNLVKNIITDQKISIKTKNLIVSNSIPQGLIWTVEDEAFKIIFRNLLSNAIKFTPTGGKIDIKADNDETQTRITVKDTGIGISDDMMKKINAENYHTSKGTHNEEGTGFGLILIRDLIKKYNGKLQIASTPGEGSAFTITLPSAIAVIEAEAL